jgi:PTS system ascorbate-specific IIA component
MNLRDLLRPQLVDVSVKAKGWEDAVRRAGSLLVADDAIEARFIDAMIQVAKDLGPYIVVAPGIALRNDPVFLVVTLAAVDNEQHVTGLAQMAAVLGDEELVERIRATKDKDEILEIMLSKVDEETET